MSCSSVGTAPPFSGSPHPDQHPHHIDTREHKLRIVERLGTVGNALQSEVFSQQNSCKSPIGPLADNQVGIEGPTLAASAPGTEGQTIREGTVIEVIDLTKVKPLFVKNCCCLSFPLTPYVTPYTHRPTMRAKKHRGRYGTPHLPCQHSNGSMTHSLQRYRLQRLRMFWTGTSYLWCNS